MRRGHVMMIGLLIIGLALNGTTLPGYAAETASHGPAAVSWDSHSVTLDDGVYAVRTLPDGTTSYDHWTPAAGVTSDELRASLRAQGVEGILPAGAAYSMIPSDPNNCRGWPRVDTAAAWCNGTWTYGAYNDPQVYFLDSTPASWPVTDARADWWLAPGIDAYYRWYTQGCPSGVHCVHVDQDGTASDNWYGWTTAQKDDSGHVIEGSVQIKLNPHTTPNTYAVRRAVACHEMGHALTLAHNQSTDSCLEAQQAFSQHPSSDDFAVLNAAYPKPGT